MIKLRPYQDKIINDVLNHLIYNNRCCVSLSTGGGKTVIFSSLVHHLVGRTLILVHREELVHQTSKTLTLNHDVLIPKTKNICLDLCVAMVQTFHNRVKKGQIDINLFDNIIVDEAHRGDFIKIIEDFKGKVIGFTATPNYEKFNYFFKCDRCGQENDKKIECCKKQMKKYKHRIPLSKYYNTLINGIQIDELIESGYLVKDESFVLNVDTSQLIWDELRQDYSEESVSLVYGTPEAIENTIKTYMDLAYGKKTIIFNSNTLINKKLYDAMFLKGLNVKMYDSKNSNEKRKDVIEWFKNTKDAILLNVHIFTTGFDVTDVEVIFLNKKTKSLNLYLQMIGRGGRITDKIYKPKFKVIDMGNNFQDFGNWSDPRNWNKYFNDEFIKHCGTPKPASTRVCHSCEAINAANNLFCIKCGTEKLYSKKNQVVGLPIRNGKFVMPSSKSIIDYSKENNLDMNDARKIVYSMIAEMFIDTNHKTFIQKKMSGELFNRTKEFIKPYYFSIQKSNLKGNKCRTLNSFVNECIKSIQKMYENRGNITS
jgi:superfamily II DNA or RNA helicase